MKIIFLDIDGVLNYRSFFDKDCNKLILIKDHEFLSSLIDYKKIDLVNQIIEQTGAKIVLSTTWRDSMALNAMRHVFKKIGLKGFILSSTPTCGSCRSDEIQQWLDEFDKEVESFVILDDEDDMGSLKNRLVQTSYETGLTENHIKKVIEILNK